MLDLLRVEAMKAAELIRKAESVHIFTHYDADGISSGAVLATAVNRLGKQFHVTFFKGLNSVPESEADLIILSDMGSGCPDIVERIEKDVVIVDHHAPVGRIESGNKVVVHVNPHLSGLDGTYELCASGAAFVVADCLGDNDDLTGVAVAGILGDKQKITGGNAEIINRGVKSKNIEIKKGLNLHSGKLRDVLRMSTEPFLDFYGKEDELDEFLKKAGFSGEEEVDELSEEETRRLANAIVLRLIKQGAYEGVLEEFIGKKIILKSELIENAITFTDVVNSCGRASACSIGFAICVKDDRYLEKGYEIWRKFQTELLEEIARRREEVKEGECIRYLVMENAPSTGPVATVLSRYLFSDKPFIAVNIKNETAKVSSRANPKIKVDLGEVMRIAAEKAGGRGGGHSVAAGATIPPENVEEFIREVDSLCCAMLNSS